MNHLENMIWDLIDINIDAIPVSDKIFVEFNEFNNSDILGTCVLNNFKNGLFKNACLQFNYNEISKLSVIETINVICHEIAHLICEENYDIDEHDELWQDVVIALGATPNYY